MTQDRLAEALTLLAEGQQPRFVAIAFDAEAEVLSLRCPTGRWYNLWLETGDRAGAAWETNGDPGGADVQVVWEYLPGAGTEP